MLHSGRPPASCRHLKTDCQSSMATSHKKNPAQPNATASLDDLQRPTFNRRIFPAKRFLSKAALTAAARMRWKKFDGGKFECWKELTEAVFESATAVFSDTLLTCEVAFCQSKSFRALSPRLFLPFPFVSSRFFVVIFF